MSKNLPIQKNTLLATSNFSAKKHPFKSNACRSTSVQLMTWCISVLPVTGGTLIITGEVLGAGIWVIASKQTAHKGNASDKMDPMGRVG